MRKISFISAVLIISIGIYGILSFAPTPKKSKLYHELGFSINPSAGSGVVTFALLSLDSATHKIVKKSPLTEAKFVMYSKGLIKNIANPKKVDFFKEAGVDCGIILDDPKSLGGVLVVDTLWEEMKPICLPVWDIWKLRYNIHPKYGKGASAVPEEDIGWAANRWRPSYKQTLYLGKNYGIKNISDYFHGPTMYELFADMQNPDWITMYKELN